MARLPRTSGPRKSTTGAERKPRTTRPIEEKRAEFLSKIEYHKKSITSLEQKIEALDKPTSRRPRMTEKMKTQRIFEAALAAGKTPVEIAAAIGIEVPEEWL
jgi:hypothetical protein